VRRAIEAAAEAASDVAGRAFWWSNCIQLRWMLWAMSHGGSLEGDPDPDGDASAADGGMDEFDWVMQVGQCCCLGVTALVGCWVGPLSCKTCVMLDSSSSGKDIIGASLEQQLHLCTHVHQPTYI
jgi:hypothetical protein